MDLKHLLYKLKHNIFEIIACACAFYESITYSGIYQMVAEKQLESSGSYSDKLSFMASVIVYLIIALIIKAVVGKIFPALNLESQETTAHEEPEETYAQYKMRKAKNILLIAVSLLVVGSIAAFAGSHFFSSPAHTNFIVSKDAEPKSSHITAEGTLRLDYSMEYSEKDKHASNEKKYMIIPIVPADWKEGEPLTYFIRTNKMKLPDVKNHIHNIEKEQSSFTAKFEGYIVKNGLPGMVAEDYKKHQISVTDPYYLIDYQEPFNIIIFAEAWKYLAGVIVLVFGIYGSVLYIQAKRA